MFRYRINEECEDKHWNLLLIYGIDIHLCFLSLRSIDQAGRGEVYHHWLDPFRLLWLSLQMRYVEKIGYCLRYLIQEYKMDPTESTVNNHHPEWDCLLIACQKNDGDAVSNFVKVDVQSIHHTNTMGQSALHIAALWNHVECVKILLDHGANVHGRNTFTGATPLHECIQSFHFHPAQQQQYRHRRRLSSPSKTEQNYRRQQIDCIKLLLEANADPNALDAMNRTPLECCVTIINDGDDDGDDDDRTSYYDTTINCRTATTDRQQLHVAVAEIKKMFQVSQQTKELRTEIGILLTKKLTRTKVTMNEIDTYWKEKILPLTCNNKTDDSGKQQQLHLQSTYCFPQLLEKLVSLTNEWINRTSTIDDCYDYNPKKIICNGISNTVTIAASASVEEFFFGRISWLWKVITTIVSVHRSVRNNNDSGGNSVDNDNNFTSLLSLEASYAKIQQNSLTMFGMEILDRYGRLKQKQEKYSDEHSATGSLLHDDTILASWKKTIVIFMTTEKERMKKSDEVISNSNDDDIDTGPGPGSNKIDCNTRCDSRIETEQLSELQQAWMIIARRNYLELAILWWDTLRISPIGVTNRQSMTPLMFASRSGHLHLVRWLLLSKRIDHNNDDPHRSLFYYYNWVQHRDQQEKTALLAAKTNQHKGIVQFLQNYTEEVRTRLTSSSPS